MQTDEIGQPGDRLRAERQQRGIELEQVSRSTKIPQRHLEAFEGRNWKALPDTVFTRGYLRTYTETLGLDPDYWLKLYARELRLAGSAGGPEGGLATEAILQRIVKTRGADAPRSGSRHLWWMLILGSCAFAAVVWLPAVVDRMFEEGSPLVSPVRARNAGLTSPATSSARQVPPPVLEPVQEKAGPSNPPLIEAPGPVQTEAAVVSPPPVEANLPQKQEPELPRIPEPPAHDSSPAANPSLVPAPATLPGPARLEVPELGVGTSVQNLQLQGRSERFEEGTVVWFWTRILGGQAGETVRHVWIHGGSVVGIAELRLGGPHWRTQSRRQLPAGSAGEWSVEAQDSQGRVLGTAHFECVQ